MRDAAMHVDAWVNTAHLSSEKWLSSWFSLEQTA